MELMMMMVEVKMIMMMIDILTAHMGEVKPSTAACRPSATNGTMFSPKRVSRYRALKMFRACT